MAKKNFKRGIEANKKNFRAAKDFFSSPLGRSIVEAEYNGSRSFQICIRDGYFNVYWRGCSVLKYRPSATKYKFSIHHKYLPADSCQDVDSKNPYIALHYQDECNLVWDSWSFRDTVLDGAQKGMIPGFENHVSQTDEKSKEKSFLSQYFAEVRPLLLDLEVAFTGERKPEEMAEKSRRYVADRVDFARLVIKEAKPVLQLVEAKSANDGRLRAQAQNNPKIIGQMDGYLEFIKREKTQIEDSYRRVAENYLSMNLLGWSSEDLDCLKAFAKEPALDPQPYLLVLGTRGQMQGRANACHWQRLERLLGENGYPAPEMWDGLSGR